MLVMYFNSKLKHLGHLSLTPRLINLTNVGFTTDCAKPRALAISSLLICTAPRARFACKIRKNRLFDGLRTNERRAD